MVLTHPHPRRPLYSSHAETGIKFETDSFRRLAAELQSVKRYSSQEMLIYMGRMLARFLIRVTPPFGKHPFSESWSEQQAQGRKSIRRDYHRSFRVWDTESLERIVGNINNRAARYILKYISEGQHWKADKIIGNHLKNAGIIHYLTYTRAKSSINFNTSPHKTRQRLFVVNQKSIGEAIKESYQHIGKAKAGWMKAASKLGVKGIPKWISGKSSVASGNLIDNSHARNPSMELINSTQGADAKHLNVVGAAFNELYRSGLVKQLEHIGRKRAARFNSGQRQIPFTR